MTNRFLEEFGAPTLEMLRVVIAHGKLRDEGEVVDRAAREIHRLYEQVMSESRRDSANTNTDTNTDLDIEDSDEDSSSADEERSELRLVNGDAPVFMKVTEAARIVGIDRKTFETHSESMGLRIQRIGKVAVILRTAFDEFLAQTKAEAERLTPRSQA